MISSKIVLTMLASCALYTLAEPIYNNEQLLKILPYLLASYTGAAQHRNLDNAQQADAVHTALLELRKKGIITNEFLRYLHPLALNQKFHIDNEPQITIDVVHEIGKREIWGDAYEIASKPDPVFEEWNKLKLTCDQYVQNKKVVVHKSPQFELVTVLQPPSQWKCTATNLNEYDYADFFYSKEFENEPNDQWYRVFSDDNECINFIKEKDLLRQYQREIKKESGEWQIIETYDENSEQVVQVNQWLMKQSLLAAKNKRSAELAQKILVPGKISHPDLELVERPRCWWLLYPFYWAWYGEKAICKKSILPFQLSKSAENSSETTTSRERRLDYGAEQKGQHITAMQRVGLRYDFSSSSTYANNIDDFRFLIHDFALAVDAFYKTVVRENESLKDAHARAHARQWINSFCFEKTKPPSNIIPEPGKIDIKPCQQDKENKYALQAFYNVNDDLARAGMALVNYFQENKKPITGQTISKKIMGEKLRKYGVNEHVLKSVGFKEPEDPNDSIHRVL